MIDDIVDELDEEADDDLDGEIQPLGVFEDAVPDAAATPTQVLLTPNSPSTPMDPSPPAETDHQPDSPFASLTQTLQSEELPTPNLHNTGFVFQSDYPTVEDDAARDYEAPPLGIPRGLSNPSPTEDEDGRFDNLFSRLNDQE